MFQTKYTFEEFGFSSKLIRDLITSSAQTQPFLHHFFSLEQVKAKAEKRTFSKAKRQLLKECLLAQNVGLNLSSATISNIESLESDHVFTITTGHQLNAATGPLYTIYKILEVINWTEKMNELDGDRHYVPVFWMATEDHDFEEINNINLFGQKIEWQHEGTDKSVVGRLETKAMTNFIDEVLEKFGAEDMKDKVLDLLKHYQSGKTLAGATRSLINALFGEYGLVIIDGDDAALKQSFAPIAAQELEKGIGYQQVSQTNIDLAEKGYHQQVYVRPVNLFYIQANGKRVRIDDEGKDFRISDQQISKVDLLNMIQDHPENFSPNALLRPVYQEAVLPNLVYVGGGGEIAYWLQLKTTFGCFGIDFPLLKVRDSVVLLNEKTKVQLADFEQTVLGLKQNTEDLIKDYVLKHTKEALSLSQEKAQLNEIKVQIIGKALGVDKNAGRFVEAEFQRITNQFDKMEKKFVQGEKKKQEKSIKQLERLKHVVFPKQSFQERYDNILAYVQYPNLISDLKKVLNERMTEVSAIHIVDI